MWLAINVKDRRGKHLLDRQPGDGAAEAEETTASL